MNINCINTLIKISIIIVVGACHCKNGDTDQFKLPSVPIDMFRHDSLIGTLQDFTSINSCKCIVFLDGNCGMCLSNLNTVCVFLKSLNIPYLFVICTKSRRTFTGYCDHFNLDLGLIVFETTDRLQQLNKLPDINFLLLNEKNEMISTKNPIMNKKDEKFYRKIAGMEKNETANGIKR